MFGGKSAVLGVGPCPSGACDGGNNYTLRVDDSISVTWNFQSQPVAKSPIIN